MILTVVIVMLSSLLGASAQREKDQGQLANVPLWYII